jgi:hypothetical protein
LTKVADTSGQFAGFLGRPTINSAGTVAFAAFFDSGGSGIYTGDDFIADKVVEPGDVLFGSTVQNIGSDAAINDDGSIAFRYTLANGVSGIAVASPSPSRRPSRCPSRPPPSCPGCADEGGADRTARGRRVLKRGGPAPRGGGAPLRGAEITTAPDAAP